MEKKAEKEVVSCLLCGKNEADAIFKFQDLKIVRCRNCRFMYQNPRDRYIIDCNNSDDCYQGYINATVPRKMLFNSKFDEFLSHRKPGKILDIGCAAGQFLMIAKERGWQTAGIDVAKSACDYLIKQGYSKIFNGTLEDVNFQDEEFDAVHMNHVFEHIHWPQAFLKEIHRILKPGGLIILEVPNESIFPYNYKMINIFRHKNTPPRSSHKKHVSLFTCNTLKQFLIRQNFRPEVIRIEGFASKSRLLTPIFQNRSFIVKGLLLLCRYQVDVKLGFGRYIVAVARKEP